LEELYVLDKQIGKGAFGVVRLGHHKATSEPAAVKSISKAKLTCKEDVQDVQAEVAIMNLVAGHGNVVMLQVRGSVGPGDNPVVLASVCLLKQQRLSQHKAVLL
jgi:serine/threonine protein kinase